MPRRSMLLLPSLLAQVGCGACDDAFLHGLPIGVPFTHGLAGELALPLGAVGTSCDAQGERDVDGAHVTYAHRTTSDGACLLSTTWEGTLLDATRAKEELRAALAEKGVDGDVAKVTFTKVSFALGAVAFRDAQDRDVALSAVRSYRAALHVAGQDEVVVVEHAAPADPSQPDFATQGEDAVVAALNEAWQDGAHVPGTGDAASTVDMKDAVTLAEADAPSLRVEYLVEIEGVLGF